MQQLNPSEISDIIKGRIQGLDVTAEAQNEGTIVGVSDGIVRIHGLADAQYGEMIEFDGPVIFDCVVEQNENVFPMIPSGKAHNEMLLGDETVKEEISDEGKVLV